MFRQVGVVVARLEQQDQRRLYNLIQTSPSFKGCVREVKGHSQDRRVGGGAQWPRSCTGADTGLWRTTNKGAVTQGELSREMRTTQIEFTQTRTQRHCSSFTSEQPGDGQVYADRLLGDFVRTDVEDLLAHVEVGGLALVCPVVAMDQCSVAFSEGLEQDRLLHVGG